MAKPCTSPQALDPVEFGELVGIAIGAGQRSAPRVETRPDQQHGPYTLAALALREHLADRPERFDSAMARFVALMHLFAGGQLTSWVRPSPNNSNAQDIHPAVVHVAAEMPLNRNGKFPTRKFLAEVDKIAAARYQHVESW